MIGSGLSLIAARKSVFSSLVLACSVTSIGAGDAKIASGPKAKAVYEAIQRQPMIFFVANGMPNACGRGCSEWIAAEGAIDEDVGQRFRDFLRLVPRGDLPVFFNSNGGMADQAIVLGTLIRKHRMTVGVARTIPEGCRQTATIDAACRRVMQSKGEHRARLVTGGARCFSGCAYAFVGGVVRSVARDAQLGIHAGRELFVPPPSQITLPDGIDLQTFLKRYVTEMGVDPGLIDAAAEVKADCIRFVSRDDMARFGIETRGSYETQWMTHQGFQLTSRQGLLNGFFVVKSITEAMGADSTDYRTSSIRISCAGRGAVMSLIYEREPSSNESVAPAVIRVAVGTSEYVLWGKAKGINALQTVAENNKIIGRLVLEIGEAKAGSEQQSVAVSSDFLRSATAAPSIVITESFAPRGNGPGSSRLVKFSTDGLSKALGHLQKNCGQAKIL